MTRSAERRSANMPDALTGPLFVLSVWRSGSSLLYTLLNQHSQIGLLYEGDLPRLHSFLRGRFQNGTWRERWEFWNQGPSRHGIAIETMPANVSDAWEATRIVYQEVARGKQATIWGEKTPHWYDCPLPMAERFPDARFIFLWRDMNAVLRSIASAARTERFFRKAGFTERVLIGNENLRRAFEMLKAKGCPVHEVNYEDLISNPSESLRQICVFLGLPFEERMASLEGADRSAIAAGPHHTMVRRNKIARKKQHAEILAPALRAKINRYICRWRRLSGGRWPKYPATLPAASRPPSLLELWRDRIFYKAALGRDKFVVFVYAVVPIEVARVFRTWLRQHSQEKRITPGVSASRSMTGS
jgi:Sulfotransferase family